jgi:hypothetical protein
MRCHATSTHLPRQRRPWCARLQRRGSGARRGTPVPRSKYALRVRNDAYRQHSPPTHFEDAASHHSPIRSYRYTVAMFPLPYTNVLKNHTRQNVGGISILAFNTNVPESVAHILGTPDRTIQTFSATIPRSQISGATRHLYLCGPAPAPRPRTETCRAS